MSEAAKLVELIADCDEVDFIEKLSQAEQLKAYRQLEAFFGGRADDIRILSGLKKGRKRTENE